MNFKEFTAEEEKELQHLVNVLKYAKSNHRKKKAQEKFFDKVNEHIETELEKSIEIVRKKLLN